MSTDNRKKLYSLKAKFNGELYSKRTDDLDETIKSLKPNWLHTDVYFTVKNGNSVSERHLQLRQAKRVFNDDFTRGVFIHNLLLA